MSLKSAHDWLDVCAKVVILLLGLSTVIAMLALAVSLFKVPR